MEGEIRGAIMVAPCVSLNEHLDQEKEQKFYFKKLVKEVSRSLEIREEDIEGVIMKEAGDYEEFKTIPVPLYMVQPTSLIRYKNQFSLIQDIYNQRMKNGFPTDLFYVLPEKRDSLGKKFVSYFSLHEKDL